MAVRFDLVSYRTWLRLNLRRRIGVVAISELLDFFWLETIWGILTADASDGQAQFAKRVVGGCHGVKVSSRTRSFQYFQRMNELRSFSGTQALLSLFGALVVVAQLSCDSTKACDDYIFDW